MRLDGFGISAELPPGWEAVIFRRPPSGGGTTNPILHAANFPLPRRRGDFGSGAVERMGPRDVLVVLFEYEPAATTTALFQHRGRPAPHADAFSPWQLQRTLPGQGGWQRFFSEAGRAFSVYVVLGSYADRGRLVPQARELLDGVTIERRAVA